MNTEHIELLARVGNVNFPTMFLHLPQRDTLEDLVRAGFLVREIGKDSATEYAKATPKGLQFLTAITDALNAHAKAS